MPDEIDRRIKEQVLEAEKAAKVARAEIDKARRAGLDVTETERDLIATEERIRRMKAVYVLGASA